LLPPPKNENIRAEAFQNEEDLVYLPSLQKYQLVVVPFENLLLHYSKESVITLNPEDLHKKILDGGNGRGGYCRRTIHCHYCLEDLGFKVINVGAKMMSLSGYGGSICKTKTDLAR